jgi:hypothetical protein
MSWGKVDDRLPEHPKWVALERSEGPRMWADALATWVVVLCYANRNETDGFIDEAVLARISPIGRASLKAAAAMVDAGLMTKEATGFRLHGFGDYNPLRAEKEAVRAADRARKNQGVQPESARNPTGVQPDSEPTRARTRARAHPRPVPAPPGPSRPDPISTGGGDLQQVAHEPTPSESFSRSVERIRAAFVDAWSKTGKPSAPWMGGIGTREWSDLANWLTTIANGREADTAGQLATGFARSRFAETRGFRFRGPGGLIEGPGEFLALGGHVAPSIVEHVATNDAEFEEALAGGRRT